MPGFQVIEVSITDGYFNTIFNARLIQNKVATYSPLATDESIYAGDKLIVDRSLTPKSSRLILAEIDGNFACAT